MLNGYVNFSFLIFSLRMNVVSVETFENWRRFKQNLDYVELFCLITWIMTWIFIWQCLLELFIYSEKLSFWTNCKSLQIAWAHKISDLITWNTLKTSCKIPMTVIYYRVKLRLSLNLAKLKSGVLLETAL